MLAVLVMLAACNGATPSPTPGSDNSAFDIELAIYQGADDLGGERVRLSDLLAQGKPVVLNMWAGLCPVCRGEMPILQRVHEEYGDRVLVFGLDVGVFAGLGSEDDARALLDELEITFPAGTTPDEAVMREYQVFGIPAFYFISPDAVIVQRHHGRLTEEELSRHVGALLDVSGEPQVGGKQ
jgi:thiol-disulfide isomerase/thioredoxin